MDVDEALAIGDNPNWDAYLNGRAAQVLAAEVRKLRAELELTKKVT